MNHHVLKVGAGEPSQHGLYRGGLSVECGLAASKVFGSVRDWGTGACVVGENIPAQAR
jgi:hypothetical protein